MRALLGTSPLIDHLRDDVLAASRSDAKVLIVGETGVGKEVVARLIHDSSRRRTRDFVTINCAGVPDSLLESELFGHVRGSFTGAYRDKPGLATTAHHGTLFLDELGEMSLRMQSLLLRFLETGEIQRVGSDRVEGPVDVRVIAATNRNLQERIEKREFREDLYYRLNVLRLVIPPLRERGDDVGILLRHFMTETARSQGVAEPRLSAQAFDTLIRYRWPGNVRELKNVVERIVVRHRSTRDVVPDDLPRELLTALAQEAVSSSPVAALESARADAMWRRMVVDGESFWTAVYPAFIDRDITKADLRQLIRSGLQQTQGSYRRLVELFRMDARDYKRFLAFLYQHDCHLPFHGFREPKSDEASSRTRAL
ncbi:MAG TPA: sigma 54-interacting transcriptional regulator [Vicinamibacterales bacterium]|jgi:transcriptional regulator with PAS, ATPase and Fis domain